MEKSHILGVGIVGLGRSGWGMQCPELGARKERFALVAGCDTFAPWRDRFADANPQAQITDNLQALLDNPAVDIVSIATPTFCHCEHALAALAAGKSVFLEKPMCVTLEEAQRLQEADRLRPGKLFIRHNRRFEAGFRAIRAILAEGLLGQVATIKLARVSFGRRNDWQTLLQMGGGQLGNWGSHIIDHALQFLDAPTKPLRSVVGYLDRVAAVGDAEDHVKIVLQGQSGTVVDIEVSGGAALPAPEYLIWGTRGALSCSGREIRLRYLDPAVALPARIPYAGVPGAEFVLPDGSLPLGDRTIGSNFGQPETLPWVEETRTVPAGEPGQIWDALYDTLVQGVPFPIRLEEAVATMDVIDRVRVGTPFEH
ncbi:MAG: Gfo/Idh/MocA family protein [Kiritimatiellia bacterium]